MSKKDAREERNLNLTQSKYGSFFDGLNQGFFGGVTIKMVVAAGVIGAVHLVQNSLPTRQWLANNTSADGVAHWVN